MSEFDEIWGTFAVDDHTRNRAYVAEIILFDRVVVPIPPENNKQQWKEWIGNGWKPGLLKDILVELEDLAIAVPWSPDNRAMWDASMPHYFPSDAGSQAERISRLGTAASNDVTEIKKTLPDNPASWVTRMVIADRFNDKNDDALYRAVKDNSLNPATKIETLVGYGSYEQFKTADWDLKLDLDPQVRAEDGSMLFSWEAVIPGDNTMNDEQLLRKAVAIARKDEFRLSRHTFHDWRRKLMENRATPEAAQAEMTKCLKVYNEIVAKSGLNTVVRRALQISAAAAPLADFAMPGLGIGAAVMFGVGAIAADKFIPNPITGKREAIAAIIHDSREAFGWKSSQQDWSFAR